MFIVKFPHFWTEFIKENILAGAVSSDFEEKLSQNDNKKKERVYSIVNQGAYTKQKSERTY